MLLRSSLVFAAALALPGSAGAQGSVPSIYVDVGSLGYGFGVPSSTFAAAAPAAGEWNALDVDLATGPVYVTPPLVDTAGAATGVTLEWDAFTINPIGFESNEPNTTGDDEALLDDVGYVSGPSDLSFLGLPEGDYTVITYAMAPDSPTYVTNVAVPGSVDPAQDVGGDFGAGYVLGVTHAMHTVHVAAGQPLVIQISVAVSFDSVNGIQVMPALGGGGLGTSYCSPVANSTGVPAEMRLTGSAVASMNNLTLECVSMPTNAFGFFLVSRTQGFVMNPGGSHGHLCLGGAIGRYVGPGQIQNTGTTGSISLPADLNMIPSPTGFFAAQMGDTLNFQAWHRDAIGGSATSNFSDGREIVLQ